MKKLITIIITLATLSSCVSKKKFLNKEQEVINLTERIKSDSIAMEIERKTFREISKVDSTSEKTTSEVTIKEGQTIEVEGDGTGSISVTESVDENTGERTITSTGTSSLIIRDENSIQTREMNELTSLVKTKDVTIDSLNQKITQITKEHEAELEAERSRKVVDVERTGLSFWSYIWIIIGIIILLLLWYLQRRFNFLKIFKYEK